MARALPPKLRQALEPFRLRQNDEMAISAFRGGDSL
jgi:hypothetical protein